MKHKITKYSVEGPKVYCPKTKDISTGTYTTIGFICKQCNLHVKNEQ